MTLDMFDTMKMELVNAFQTLCEKARALLLSPAEAQAPDMPDAGAAAQPHATLQPPMQPQQPAASIPRARPEHADVSGGPGRALPRGSFESEPQLAQLVQPGLAMRHLAPAPQAPVTGDHPAPGAINLTAGLGVPLGAAQPRKSSVPAVSPPGGAGGPPSAVAKPAGDFDESIFGYRRQHPGHIRNGAAAAQRGGEPPTLMNNLSRATCRPPCRTVAHLASGADAASPETAGCIAT